MKKTIEIVDTTVGDYGTIVEHWDQSALHGTSNLRTGDNIAFIQRRIIAVKEGQAEKAGQKELESRSIFQTKIAPRMFVSTNHLLEVFFTKLLLNLKCPAHSN